MPNILRKFPSADNWKTMLYFMLVFTLYGFYTLSLPFGRIALIVLFVALAASLDYLLHIWQKTGRTRFPTSGLITALIVTVLLSPNVALIAYAVALVAAIASKHFLLYKRRHIFNPAAFGAALAVIAFDIPLAWWPDGYIWLVIPLGLWAAWRVRKLLLVTAFVAVYLGYFLLRGTGIAFDQNLLYLVPWFFALVMMVEPMTSPAGASRDVVFGAVTAILALVFSFYVPVFAQAPLVIALLAANILHFAFTHLRRPSPSLSTETN